MYVNTVKYKKQVYGILRLLYKKIYYPVILDIQDYIFVIKTKKVFRVDKSGTVFCIHEYEGCKKKILLHHIIMARKDTDYFNKINANTTVIISHINGINLDNRRENLMYGEIKTGNKRIKGTEIGIDKESIPVHVSYMKSDTDHGSRFILKLGSIVWKSSSSKELSIRYKLEETKKFLRLLKLHYVDLFESYFIEYSRNYKKLVNSFNHIIRVARFTNIRYKPKFRDTLKYDSKDLTTLEKNLLLHFSFKSKLKDKLASSNKTYLPCHD